MFSEHAVLFGQNRPLNENSIGAITNHLQKAQSWGGVCIVIWRIGFYLKLNWCYN